MRVKCLSMVFIVALICAAIIATKAVDKSGEVDQKFNPKKPKIPIIGVITQVLRDYKKFSDEKHVHLPSSYVKWIESAGAQVLPILLNQDNEYYERIFNQTNGLLFPGGDNMLMPDMKTPMMEAAKKLYKLAIESNDRGDKYPIWGTCLGLELLSVLTANKNILFDCSAVDVMLPVEFVERGKLFAPIVSNETLKIGVDYSKIVLDALKSKNLTYNFHHKCLINDDTYKSSGLDKFYKVLGYSYDTTNNSKFISIMEAINYPFYGVQFHPEKAPFEMLFKKIQSYLDHSRASIQVSRYMADFFVDQARENSNNRTKETASKLIYNYSPMYTGILRDMYEQRYLFPFKSREDILDIEFFTDAERKMRRSSPSRVNSHDFERAHEPRF